MLSPLDDYPVHQISEPMAHVGTSDRNFYDRYYFNIHTAGEAADDEGAPFCAVGVGQYPNLGVADAFVSVLRGGDHRVVRSSRVLGVDRMDTSVGPIRVEVDEGLRRLRVVVEPNEWGVELDAVFEAFSAAHLEARHVDRHFGRVTFDSTRFAQVGGWTGTLAVDGCRVTLSPDRFWGTRDRSWGVRPVGEPEPPGIRATETDTGFFWLYAPARFSDHATLLLAQERPDGRRVVEDAHRVPPLDATWPAQWLGRPEHDLRFVPGTRRLAGATLTTYGARGQRTAEIEVEPLLAFPLLLGTGYGLEPTWRHGMYQGELVTEGEQLGPVDDGYFAWGLTEYAARFTCGDEVGYGMFECAVMGRNDRYGFTGWS
ncbi:MAG: hypothetical protein M0029_03645 [Actinomycetota bacterium]|jgi:hypothetical protein|nr:hypothetical protein [Actinomycetota bacterium]